MRRRDAVRQEASSAREFELPAAAALPSLGDKPPACLGHGAVAKAAAHLQAHRASLWLAALTAQCQLQRLPGA